MKLHLKTSEMLVHSTHLEFVYAKSWANETPQHAIGLYSSMLNFLLRASTEKIWLNVFKTKKFYEIYLPKKTSEEQNFSQQLPRAFSLAALFNPSQWLMVDFYALESQKRLFYSKKYYDKAPLSLLQRTLTGSYSACIVYAIFSRVLGRGYQHTFTNFHHKTQTLKHSSTLVLTVKENFQQKQLFKKFLFDLCSQCLLGSNVVLTHFDEPAPWLVNFNVNRENTGVADSIAVFKRICRDQPKFICKSLFDFSSLSIDKTKLRINHRQCYAFLTGQWKQLVDFSCAPVQSCSLNSTQQMQKLTSYCLGQHLETRLVYFVGQQESKQLKTETVQLTKEPTFLILGNSLVFFATDAKKLTDFVNLCNENFWKFNVRFTEIQFSHSLFPLLGQNVGFEFNHFYLFQTGHFNSQSLNEPMAIKTHVVPSPSSTMLYLKHLKQIIKQSHGQSQERLIRKLAVVIQNWLAYYQISSNKRSFYSCDKVLFQWIWRWACRRHSNKSRQWIKEKYYYSISDQHWVFCVRKSSTHGNLCLPEHSQIQLVRPLKPRSYSSWHDENWKYWLTRLS